MRSHLANENGFTLPEMLVTILMMVMVLFAMYSIFDSSIRVFTLGNDKVEATENARLGLEKVSREVRGAYPYDKGNPSSPDTRLFDVWNAGSIAFFNDLGEGDRVVTPATEKITYDVRSTANSSAPCTATTAPCTLRRTLGTGAPQDVVDYLTFDDNGTSTTGDDIAGVRFDYLKKNPSSPTNFIAATTEPEIEVVRIMMSVKKNRGTQKVTTDVDLRNRS